MLHNVNLLDLKEGIIMKDKIRNIVSEVRKVFPSLKIENVVSDIEASVERLGINILYSDMKGLEKDERTISGFAKVNPETGLPEIVINGNEPINRQRFTIAHELGHIILHWKWLPGRTIDQKFAEISYRSDHVYSPSEKKREVQANEFAAELLVPLEKVESYAGALSDFGTGGLDRDIIIHTLSNVYKVSESMAAIQFSKIEND